MTDPIAIDFETHPITDRPDYPPEPIGVSIRWPEETASHYYAWGHLEGNNCTQEEALAALTECWDSGLDMVFHNAKFDVAVAVEKMGLPMPDWTRIHDTSFLAYLADPHAWRIGLKELAEDWLDWPAEEKDAVAIWLWDNRGILFQTHNKRVTGKHGKAGKPGEWFWVVPGDLLAPYAEGDTDRTIELFRHLFPIIQEYGMEAAYDRERELMPILMENERDGMRVDVAALKEDVEYYSEVMEHVDAWLRDRLQSPGLSFDNDRDIVAVFSERGIVRDEDWTLTKKSKQRSIAKDALPPEKYQDQEVASAFGYRNRLATCLKMFMRPWLKQALARDGWISTNWNQVRGGDGGTRTGRPSTSKPNFLNISKDFEDRSDGYIHPEFLDIDPLPLCRKYILADDGHLFLHRDFSGQEVRIFAHFEQGDLCKAYNLDPDLDPHSWLKELIKEVVGKVLERTRVKNVTFSRLYGGGAGAVYTQARCADMQEAKELIAAHDAALPGRKMVVDEITRIIRRGGHIRTWGGRIYYVEPPRVIDGRKRSFEYKLINYLVQGSAADLTKECLIAWYKHPRRDPRTRFLVTVYDELNISAPEDCWEEQMAVLKECMEDVELDVPMRTDAKVGAGWGSLKSYADPIALAA